MSLAYIGIGGGYAFAGQGGTVVPEAFRVILLGGHLPGGFRTHGWIMVLLGLVQFWGVSSIWQGFTRRGWQVVQLSSYGIIGYSVWIAVAFGGQSVHAGQYNAGFWYYVFIATVATAKTLLPPPWR